MINVIKTFYMAMLYVIVTRKLLGFFPQLLKTVLLEYETTLK